MKIYTTGSGKNLGEKIARCLGTTPSPVNIGKYPDGQIFNHILETPHNEVALVVGNTQGPVEFTELLTLLDTVQGFSVQKTVVIVPYFGAGRQDRADQEGEDIAGRMQMTAIASRRPNRVLLVDLHNAGIQYCTALDMRIRVKELYAKPIFFDVIRDMRISSEFVFASADVGRLRIARSYAKEFNVSAVSLDKRRAGPGEVEVMHIIGDVANKTVIMIDDIVDSGGTVMKGAEALKNAGAKDIHLFATHAVLSGQGYERFAHSNIFFASAHITDTIAIREPSMFQVHSIAPLIAEYTRKEIL